MIREYTELVREMHRAIFESESQGKYDEMEALLIEAQNCMVELGTELEKVYGEDSAVIKRIEFYCEYLYEINMDENHNADIHVGKLNECWESIVTAINLSPTCRKKKVVFLPYKASMWDALESIWMEFKDDDTYDCKVVPIPYFDITSEGHAGEFHYEGNLLPDYVSITDWKDYKLSEECPDAVFIHNPYDDYNRVTSVHPDFYSSNIKKYAKYLIYSPYYVTGPHSGQKNFMTYSDLPGIKNSDFVIVQSAIHKRLFMGIGLDANRIWLCGSPKLEAYNDLSYFRNNIPVEWKKKIEGKKIVILNSSIGTLLADDINKYLNNVRKMIEDVSKFENMLLLWRPHPLLYATVKAMRSEGRELYEETIRYARKNGVIIDETADTRYASSIANAMISDESSWPKQFAMTGKPVLYLKMQVTRSAIERGLQVFDETRCYYQGDGITIGDFCRMVIANEDPDRDERMKRVERSVVNPKIGCGRAVKTLLEQNIL